MTEKFDYMSDEELELLIAHVEQNELVAAPPDMLEGILERVRESKIDAETVSDVKNASDKPDVLQSAKSVTNIREFRRYCF